MTTTRPCDPQLLAADGDNVAYGKRVDRLRESGGAEVGRAVSAALAGRATELLESLRALSGLFAVVEATPALERLGAMRAALAQRHRRELIALAQGLPAEFGRICAELDRWRTPAGSPGPSDLRFTPDGTLAAGDD